MQILERHRGINITKHLKGMFEDRTIHLAEMIMMLPYKY